MDSLPKHFLYPSTLFASSTPSLVTTILGSCVAVCIFDPVLNIGGINHFMLPLWNGQGLASPKYGNIAIERLMEKMYQLGSKKSNLTAKIFGGGEVIDTNIRQFNIGERNISIAFEMLENLRIPVIAKSVGGKLGRKIEFNSSTGEVKHRFIERNFL
jgi:chemotaxis protein CheD